MSGLRYRRVILKLSGEAVQGDASAPIDHDVLDYMARQVAPDRRLGVQVAVVIGGGNIWRGEAASERGMERATADYMGMLATVINGLALQASLERHGLHTRVQSAITMSEVCRAVHPAAGDPAPGKGPRRHLRGRHRQPVLQHRHDGRPAGRRDRRRSGADGEEPGRRGVRCRPAHQPERKRFSRLRYMDAIERGLRVMDTTALSLCMDNRLPIVVFDLMNPSNLERIVLGDESVGTVICMTWR